MGTLKTKTQLLKEIADLKQQLNSELSHRLEIESMYETELKAHKAACGRIDAFYETETKYREDLLKTIAKYQAENKELKEKLAAYENIDAVIKFIKSALKDDNAR